MPATQTAIIVPCYNESARLPVAEFGRFLDSSAVTLIFVNDGSTDATMDLLQTIQQRRDRVHVVNLDRNGGKAEAVRQGMNFAFGLRYDYVGFWDADLATPLTCIAEFEELLSTRSTLDMVFGARVKLLGRYVERRALRHYLGRVFATAASVVLRLPIYDSQCGAKLFRNSEALQEICRQPFQSRWVFDVEILARYIATRGSATAAAWRIYEYPLSEWSDVAGSKVRPRDFFTAFLDLSRIFWAYRVRPAAASAVRTVHPA